MAKVRPDDGLTKFQRYRDTKRNEGMKLPRIWVPDSKAPGFREEALRQANLISRTPEDIETTRFMDAGFEWPDE